MSTYFNDASSLTGWTEEGILAGTDYSVSSGTLTGSVTQQECLTLDAAGSGSADLEIVVKVKIAAFSGTHHVAVLRQSGTTNTNLAAWMVAIRSTGLRVSYKNASGSITALTTATISSRSNDTYYRVRFRVNSTGNAIKARIWLDGDSEPGTWDVDTTSTAGPTGAGKAGLVLGVVATAHTWDFVGVGTNGDTAPASAGGGGTDLTVADALHAHAADNVVLTSATAITIADALHAHAADNVVLTSATAITIADALHAHAADNVVLTSATAITIADALHAHAADNVVLEVSGTTNLTVADALHAHAADNLVLTSQIAIVVADALHAHTADGLTLTAASVLALQDALHAHAADNLTLELSGGITLTLADALHAHTADGVLLTVSAYLVVSDALHAHTADNILLSIPGAFRAGNPRVWILDSRQRYSMVDSRRRVVHLN